MLALGARAAALLALLALGARAAALLAVAAMLPAFVLVPGFSAPHVADQIKVTIDATKVLHAANPMYMGCHSDSARHSRGATERTTPVGLQVDHIRNFFASPPLAFAPGRICPRFSSSFHARPGAGVGLCDRRGAGVWHARPCARRRLAVRRPEPRTVRPGPHGSNDGAPLLRLGPLRGPRDRRAGVRPHAHPRAAP